MVASEAERKRALRAREAANKLLRLDQTRAAYSAAQLRQSNVNAGVPQRKPRASVKEITRALRSKGMLVPLKLYSTCLMKL